MTTPSRPNSPRFPALLAFLVGGILVALVVLIILMLTASDKSSHTTDTLKPLADGQSVTREQIEEQGVRPSRPSSAIESRRMEQSCPAGRSTRIVVTAVMDTRASLKDWGIVQTLNMHYKAELEVIRTIESNNGQALVETREFRKARNLSIFCSVEDVSIDVGSGGVLVLAGLDYLADTPGVFSALQGLHAKRALQMIPGAQKWADRVATDSTAKVFAFVDKLEGKKIRLEYINGRGVTKLTPVGCSLTGDEQAVLTNLAVLSDAYVMPKLECQVGDRWTIQGVDMLPVIDPSLRSSLSGSLSAHRGPDRGGAQQAEASVVLDDGMLELHDVEEASETVGRWAPRGTLIFSFNDQMVREGELGGALLVEKHSTRHILFEARQTVKPQYKVTYFCQVLK